MGRPRIHADDSSTARNRASRARLGAGGGRQITLALSADDLARVSALREREGLPSDAAAMRRALEIAAQGEGGPSDGAGGRFSTKI